MKMILLYLVGMIGLCKGSSQDGLNFLVLGDWGGLPWSPYETDVENATSIQMSKTAGATSSSFVVALGDNFYYTGVVNNYDVRFEQTYTHVFNQPSLQIPWYVIAGNHDHYGNASAQIAYSTVNPHWKFPNFWHAKKWSIPGTNKTLKVVLIDTVLLCGNCGMDDDLEQPKGAEDAILAEEQWKWLEVQLMFSKDDYLIVGGHFPVWSIAEHGPTHCLVNRLKPLLEQYKVNTYICGHDHNLQHLKEDDSDVNYFVVGSANFVADNTSHLKSVPTNSSKFYMADISKKGGFAHVRVLDSEMKFTLIDSLGDILHEVVMKPRTF